MKRKTDEARLLEAYENAELKSVVPSKTELRKHREAARATFVKDRRVNVRLPSPDLMDVQARAAVEGMPYQTLIASVLHKYVSGRLQKKPSGLTTRSSGRARWRAP